MALSFKFRIIILNLIVKVYSESPNPNCIKILERGLSAKRFSLLVAKILHNLYPFNLSSHESSNIEQRYSMIVQLAN